MFKDVPAFFSFSVDDIQKAKTFYGDVLGLIVSEESMGILRIRLGGGGEAIAYPKPDHVPATYTILNFPVGSIEDAVDELANRGVAFYRYFDEQDEKGINRGEGPLIAWFKDPAGNILSVLEDGS